MTYGPLTLAAAEYLTRGLPVIALTGKTPNVKLHKGGLNDALNGAPEGASDWEFIAGFFEHRETTGVGIVIPYPYVVVDIDGEEGALQWAELLGHEVDFKVGTTSAGPLDLFADSRWVAKTPRLPAGGLHLWFTCSTPTGSMKLGSKLDLKGQLSYVAAPPSLHPDGGTYEWLRPPTDAPVMEGPEVLITLIEDHAFDLQGKLEKKAERARAYGPRWQSGDHVYYAQASHDAVIERMKTAVEGNRNAYLHWAAATLAEEAGSNEEFEQLAEAALAVGLTREEVKRTVRSARRAHG